MRGTFWTLLLLGSATHVAPRTAHHAVATIEYLGSYSGGSRVSIWRGQTANIVVHGQFVDLNTGVELVNSATGAIASGVTVSQSDHIGGGDTRITLHVSSTSSAPLGDYQVRIHYLVETNGPDRVDLRMFDKQSVTGVQIAEPAQFARYVVGQTYTLVATGSGLSHATFNAKGADVHGLTLVSTLSRSNSEARFQIRVDSAKASSLGPWDFFDDAMRPANPSDAQRFVAGYGPSSGGSDLLTVVGAVLPIVTSATPFTAAEASTVTLSGNGITPRGFSVSVDFPKRYRILNNSPHASTNATKGNGTLSFSVPFEIGGDSGRVHFAPDGSSPVDSIVPVQPTIPVLNVVGAPVVLQTPKSGLLQKVLFEGTRVLLGEYLFTTTISCTQKSVGCGPATRPPTVTFGNAAIPVASVSYSPTAQVDHNQFIQQGVDSLRLTVPSIANQATGDLPDTTTGTLTITTPGGSTTLTNVFYAPRPQISLVQQSLGNGQFQTVTTSTLVKGATYRLQGRALDLIAGGTRLSTTQIQLNGTVVSTTNFSNPATIGFIVPATATSGPLVVTTAAGSTTVGTFTVSSGAAGVTIVGVQLSPASVAGGNATTATIAVNASIPSGGSAGNLIFSTQPQDSSVVLPAGLVAVTSNPLIIQLSTKAVTSARSVQINVSNEPGAQTHTFQAGFLVLTPPAATGVTLAAPAGTGGQTITGTVQLNTNVPASLNIPISLVSSDPTTATVPSSVIASGNAVTFTITTKTVPAARTVTISATVGGQTQTASLAVNPSVPSSLVLAQTTAVAEVADTATLTLTAAPAAPVDATITCADAALVCPASVTVSGTVVKFAVRSIAIPAPRTVTVSATLNGVTKTATLNLVPLGIQTVTISPTSVRAGTSSSMTIQLNASVVGTLTVQLSSSNVAASIASTQNFSTGNVVKLVTVTTPASQTQTSAVTLTAAFTRQTTFGPYTSSATGTLTVAP